MISTTTFVFLMAGAVIIGLSVLGAGIWAIIQVARGNFKREYTVASLNKKND